MTKSVLLVGGAGFLGLHLVEQFWRSEPRPKIHVFDIRPLPEKLYNPEGVEKIYTFDSSLVEQHQGDLTNEDDVKRVIKLANPDVIVHSASPVHGMGSGIYYQVNVKGTQNLLKCAKELGVGAFVYTSSAGVVFNGEDLFNADETYPFPRQHMDAYNKTKQQAEEMVLAANDPEGKFLTCALRPAGIFGPGDRQMIPALRAMGRQGQNKFQLGDNLNLFDVTYVGNVAYSHVLAADMLLDATRATKLGGQAILVTNDSPIYFWSLGKEVWKQDGTEPKFTIVIPKAVGVLMGYMSQTICSILGKEPTLTAFRVKTSCATRYYDISKAKEILNYKPKWTLEEAIKITLKSME